AESRLTQVERLVDAVRTRISYDVRRSFVYLEFRSDADAERFEQVMRSVDPAVPEGGAKGKPESCMLFDGCRKIPECEGVCYLAPRPTQRTEEESKCHVAGNCFAPSVC